MASFSKTQLLAFMGITFLKSSLSFFSVISNMYQGNFLILKSANFIMCKALKVEIYKNRANTQDATSCKQVACKKQKKDVTNMKIEHRSSYCNGHSPHKKHVR
jgi:hypothetical protein